MKHTTYSCQHGAQMLTASNCWSWRHCSISFTHPTKRWRNDGHNCYAVWIRIILHGTFHMKNIENTEICPLTKIPYLKLNQGQHPCLFVHANGYPSHCYLPMLEQLSGCEVYAPLSRPCWDKSDPNMTDQWPLLFNTKFLFSKANSQHIRRILILKIK